MDYQTLKTKVRENLIDTEANDDSAKLAVMDFVRGNLARNLSGDTGLKQSFLQDYRRQRNRLYGYTFSQDLATLQSEMIPLLTEGDQSDAAFEETCALYVQAEVARHVGMDQNNLHESYYRSYVANRLRLLGYEYSGNDTTLKANVRVYMPLHAQRLDADFQAFVDASILRAKDDIESFKAAVDELIKLAKNDIEGTSTQIDAFILNGCIDLQRFITFYQDGQTSVYKADDLDYATEMGRGVIIPPEGAHIREAFIVQTDENGNEISRTACKILPWSGRFDDILCSEGDEDQAKMTASPYGDSVYFMPALVQDEIHLELRWDGIQRSFTDLEEVKFEEDTVEALAAFVRWKHSLKDKEVGNAKLLEQDYTKLRWKLYQSSRRRTSIDPNR
jgi:hypothetical protein